MARALNDPSLNVTIREINYDEEADDFDNLTTDDARAVIDYFFSGEHYDQIIS